MIFFQAARRGQSFLSVFAVAGIVAMFPGSPLAAEETESHAARLLSQVDGDSQAPPVAAPLGESLPPLDFYRALQPGISGLEAVYAAVEAENTEAAMHAFAAYLRSKSFEDAALKVLPEKPAGAARMEAGEAAAEHKITLLGKTVEYGESISWTENTTEFSDWLLMLNRHGHWQDLAAAFEQTGNPRYVSAFAGQLDSWLTGAPMPGTILQAQARGITRDRGHRRPFEPAWRTIEVGERLRGAWPTALGAFIRQPALDDATLIRMVAAMVRQADFLMEFQGPQNWFALENEGLLRTAVIFPEFTRARVWKDQALGRISAQLEEEVYPDGAHEELTFWYQETVRRATSGIITLADQLGLEISPVARERFLKLHESTMAAVQPDGRLPQVNDADPLRAEYILREGAGRFDRPEMIFAATRGREGEEPSYQSVALPWAGWAAMRTDWTESAGYLFFEAGPFGGHAHEDKLGFILHAHGEAFVIDTGRSAYGDDQWRQFNIGPKAHSTVLFDGKGQSRRYWRDGRLTKTKTEAEGFTFETKDEVDYATGAFGEQVDEFFYDAELGAAFIAQRRVVLFLKPDRWIVLDAWKSREGHAEVDPAAITAESLAPKQMTTLFQLNDLPVELNAARGSLVLGREDGPKLALSWSQPDKVTAEVVRGREEPSLLGWRFLGMNDGNKPEPIPTLVLERSLPGNPAANAYLFSASQAGEEARQERIALATTEPDGAVFHLLEGDRVLAEIKLNPDPASEFDWKGEKLQGRVVLEWNDKRWIFP